MVQKDSKIWIYSELHSDIQGQTMEDFKNCMLEFLKQQEKRQEYLKQQEI